MICRKCRMAKCLKVGMEVTTDGTKTCLICRELSEKVGIHFGIQSCIDCFNTYRHSKGTTNEKSCNCEEKYGENHDLKMCKYCISLAFEDLLQRNKMRGVEKYRKYLSELKEVQIQPEDNFNFLK
jgi:hypothetical protein